MLFALILPACRFAAGASYTPGEEAESLQPEETAAPSFTEPLVPPQGVVIRNKSEPGTDGISDASNCVRLGTDFLKDWCSTLLSDRAVHRPEKDELGTTSQTYGWLARLLVADPSGFCADERVITWFSMTPGGLQDRSPAAVCDEYIADVVSQGYFEVSDPETGVTVVVDLP